MKNFLLLMAFFTTVLQAGAQKIYSTRVGNISFFSSAPLEDIEAKNNTVESYLSSITGEYNFAVTIKNFRFENDLMEEHFNENYLHSDKFPKAYFKGNILNIKDINFAKDGTYPARVKGNLTIHGVTREITENGVIEVKNGRATAKSKFNITLKDYNIGGSVVGKMIANVIAITVECLYD